jgi:chaperonin GroEL
VRYIAAGGNAMMLRRHLERGAAIILDELDRMTQPVSGKARLARVAEAICHDPELAKVLGEIFDIIGAYGQLDIRTGQGRTIDREYVEGMYWDRGAVSREMLAGLAEGRAELQDGAVLISDLKFESARDLIPALNEIVRAQVRGLLIIGSDFSDEVKAFLLANRKPDLFLAIAVKTPGGTPDEQIAALEDLAVLTGGAPLYRAAEHTLRDFRPVHLGRARRIWANALHFGIVAGKGDPRALRRHIAELRDRHDQASDADLRKKLQQRLSKLLGGSATLFTGGSTEIEINARKELARRTADALRGVVRDGVVPGGGVALLACQSALKQAFSRVDDPDERAARGILHRALEMPLRTILSNAGYEASAVMAEMNGSTCGFDVTVGQVVDVVEAGLLDAASVVKTAIGAAIHGAALALTVDVMVHHQQPETTLNP